MHERLIPVKRFPIKEILFVGLLPSGLKKVVYRRRGYRLARNISFGLGSVILGADVEIEEGASFGFFSVVKAKKIRVGRFVRIGATSIIDTVQFEIGDDSKINEQVFVGGIKTPESKLIMGKRTIIMQMSFINPSMPIYIGDDTGIGGHCLLFTHGSWGSELEGFPVSFDSIRIEEKVWLPWRVFVMPGTKIGGHSVVAANSVVSGDYPARTLIAGTPAKVIKENYVKELEESAKLDLFLKRLDEFIEFLKFNEVSLEISRKHNTIDLTVMQQNHTERLFFAPSIDVVPNGFKGSLILMSAPPISSTSDFEMLISVEGGFRSGTSRVGEEFVAFISRYGIRFNRQ